MYRGVGRAVVGFLDQTIKQPKQLFRDTYSVLVEFSCSCLCALLYEATPSLKMNLARSRFSKHHSHTLT